MTLSMNFLLLAPAAMGLGVGMALFGTAGSTQRVRLWFDTLRRPARRSATSFEAVSASQVDWRANQEHDDCVRFFMRPLHHDTVRGGRVMQVRYPAGEINPPHRHPVAHGMYVLQGTLVTHRGEFGPNTFVWFPAGEAMFHGARRDEDVVVLFIAGPGLETEYLPAPSERHAM